MKIATGLTFPDTSAVKAKHYVMDGSSFVKVALPSGKERLVSYSAPLSNKIAKQELRWVTQVNKYKEKLDVEEVQGLMGHVKSEARTLLTPDCKVIGTHLGRVIKSPRKSIKLTFKNDVGMYVEPTRVLNQLVSDPTDVDITNLEVTERLYPLYDITYTTMSDAMRQPFTLFINDEGALVAYLKAEAFRQVNFQLRYRNCWAGTYGRFINGIWTTEGTVDRATAKALQPYWELLGSRYRNNWVHDFMHAPLFIDKQVKEMYEYCHKQVSKVGGVEVHAVVPRLLKYTSDGSTGSQSDYLFVSSHAQGCLNGPVLYVAPAWLVCLKFGERYLSGNVFVNSKGDFICSDWCMRETPDKKGGIDLFTGRSNKHTLGSWCAGPGMDKACNLYGIKAHPVTQGIIKQRVRKIQGGFKNLYKKKLALKRLDSVLSSLKSRTGNAISNASELEQRLKSSGEFAYGEGLVVSDGKSAWYVALGGFISKYPHGTLTQYAKLNKTKELKEPLTDKERLLIVDASGGQLKYNTVDKQWVSA